MAPHQHPSVYYDRYDPWVVIRGNDENQRVTVNSTKNVLLSIKLFMKWTDNGRLSRRAWVDSDSWYVGILAAKDGMIRFFNNETEERADVSPDFVLDKVIPAMQDDPALWTDRLLLTEDKILKTWEEDEAADNVNDPFDEDRYIPDCPDSDVDSEEDPEEMLKERMSMLDFRCGCGGHGHEEDDDDDDDGDGVD